MKTVYLKKYEDKRIRTGHLWIYSNEIDITKSPLKAFNTGELVQIMNANNQSLGIGYINPHSLLCIRILTRDKSQAINKEFFESRIKQALNLREIFFNQPYYRMIYGESDFLPGLIVDRYDDVLVGQITTAGMEQYKEIIADVLSSVTKTSSMFWRNDHGMRATENLNEYVEPAYGNPPKIVEIKENNACFKVPIWEGQKTGWFYDHRENRTKLLQHVTNKRVLDIFCYLGAWSIPAAIAGAKEIVCIDSSAKAIDYTLQNAELNGVKGKVTTLCGEAFEQLKNLQQQEPFDIIMIDPPAFIKKRKDIDQGIIAYQRINDLALRIIKPNGILISSSCSQHMTRESLLQTVQRAANKYQKSCQLIAQGHQGIDHPIHPAIPETEYLKSLFFKIY